MLGEVSGTQQDRLGIPRAEVTGSPYRGIVTSGLFGRVMFLAARALKRLGRTAAAMRFYERAAVLGFRSDRAYLRAAGLAEREWVPSTWVAKNCVIHGPQPDFVKAAEYYARSLEVRPDGEVAFKRGLALERCGELSAARDAFSLAVELSPSIAQYWYRLAAAGVKLASSSGGYTPREFAEIESALQRTLLLEPAMTQAQEQLIRLLIRQQEWERIGACLEPSISRPAPDPLSSIVTNRARGRASTASPSDEIDLLMRVLTEQSPPDRSEVSDALADPSWFIMRDLPTQAWFPLHWRLLSLGWFSEAYLAKRCLAEWVIHRNSKRKRRSIIRSLRAIQALVFLDRLEDALALFDAVKVPETPSPTQQTLLTGIRSDLHLLLGDDAPLRREPSSTSRSQREREIDLRFSGLVSGARVAVVGPAKTKTPHGSEIDDADVVIRTNLPEAAELDTEGYGSRTDVVYPALGRSVLSLDGFETAIESGQLSMVVMRSLRHRRADMAARLGSGARVNPREYLGSFVAAQFAIQRILHDVLRYGPGRVKVYNTTLFVDLDGVYYDGYNDDIIAARDRKGIAVPPRAFAHDYLADFVFTQRLRASGFIDVDDSLGSVLDSSPADYLRVLDSQ